MDHSVTLSAPVESVFAHLVQPARLGHWLPQVVAVGSVPAPLFGLGSAFTVTLHAAGGDRDVDAEVVAHEPPRLIAYRLMTAEVPVVIQATCTTSVDGTRVQVQQTEGPEPLLIDLTGIAAMVDGPPSADAVPGSGPGSPMPLRADSQEDVGAVLVPAPLARPPYTPPSTTTEEIPDDQ